jgi:hypothetical protein
MVANQVDAPAEIIAMAAMAPQGMAMPTPPSEASRPDPPAPHAVGTSVSALPRNGGGTEMVPQAVVPANPTNQIDAMPVPSGRQNTRAEHTAAFMNMREDMRAVRWATITEAQRKQATGMTNPAALTPPPVATTSPRTNPVLATPLQTYREADRARAALRDEMLAARQAAMTPPVVPGSGTETNALLAVPPKPAVGTNGMILNPYGRPGATGVQPYREADRNRAALRDEMRAARQASMIQSNVQTGAATGPLSQPQRQSLESFLAGADRLSQALAADSLDKFKQCQTNLAALVLPLQKEFAAPHRWSGTIQRLAAHSWSPALDLAEARKQFLPFSTAAVELVKQVKKEEAAFASFKIFHCPMAPKPGLWIQAKGPLANPFYGAEMLRCGTEVKP